KYSQAPTGKGQESISSCVRVSSDKESVPSTARLLAPLGPFKVYEDLTRAVKCFARFGKVEVLLQPMRTIQVSPPGTNGPSTALVPVPAWGSGNWPETLGG